MNVWIKKTPKRVKCFHCGKTIETGEYQVVCTYFMKLKHSERTWTKAMHFHIESPNCWLERAKIELESRPQASLRGRKPDALSDEARVKRQKILRRRSCVMFRIRREAEGTRRPEKLAHLANLLEVLATEIAPYGGVPESWK